MKRLMTSVIALTVSLSLVTPAFAQQRAPYTEGEKKKLAEIAKRPEVIAEIDAAWAKARNEDMAFAYRTNLTAGSADWRSNPQWLDVWQKQGRMYDNPILSNYVNALGQRLVPANSPNLYAFRLLLDPTPSAEALTTGTIYVSTGLVSLLDNEAQLAYVLAHEIAHIERNHSYDQLRNSILDAQLDIELAESAQKKRSIFAGIAAIGGAALGAKMGGLGGAQMGALIGAGAGLVGGAALFRNKFEPTRWEAVHESQADDFALNAVFDQRFDLREVPKVYTRLASVGMRDKRIGLGFMGDADRVKQRLAYVEGQLTGPMKAKITTSLGQGGLTGSSSEFSVLMAALKRDNGMLAMEYDLMPMAKENFIDAEKLRSNDPRVQFELGRLYALTGKTAEEKQLAVTHFQNAIRYDAGRNSFPDPHLFYALQLIAQNNPASQKEVQDSLKRYVSLYQVQNGGRLPSNMHVIYDYMLMAGDETWSATTALTIQTRENQPLPVLTSAPGAAAAGAAAKPRQ